MCREEEEKLVALQDDKKERTIPRRAELLARIAVLLEQLPDEKVEQLIEVWILETHMDDNLSPFQDNHTCAD